MNTADKIEELFNELLNSAKSNGSSDPNAAATDDSKSEAQELRMDIMQKWNSKTEEMLRVAEQRAIDLIQSGVDVAGSEKTTEIAKLVMQGEIDNHISMFDELFDEELISEDIRDLAVDVASRRSIDFDTLCQNHEIDESLTLLQQDFGVFRIIQHVMDAMDCGVVTDVKWDADAETFTFKDDEGTEVAVIESPRGATLA